MSTLEAEIDASFYNLIHQLSNATDHASGDRRHERRARFVSSQRIALRQTPGIPNESEFIEVQCHDLTRKGFSFFLSSPPRFRYLVVAFGTGSSPIYIAANVTHCEQVLVYESGLMERLGDRSLPDGSESQSAERMFLVGCEFVERLASSRQPAMMVE